MSINKKLIFNVLNLVVSNVIALMISILSAFITPLVLGHAQYGYYKIFSLYVSYVPLLHMGFIDGLLALNAGKSLRKISFSKFRTYTTFFIFFELILSSIMVFFSLFLANSLYSKEILISLTIYSFIFNMVTYFQFFSRCIMNFSQFSMLTRIQSYINLIYLVIALIIYKLSIIKLGFEYYLFCINLTTFIILIIYIYEYRFIIFGRRNHFKNEIKNILNMFQTGFIITISYQVSLFIFNADNQFISMFFKINKYAEYAFAYSMAALLITFFQAVSSVMLPYMKKSGEDQVLKKHSDNLSIICIITFTIILSYYPIFIIVYNFMPSYVESLKYLNIVFPGVGINCIIQSYLFNNYILQKKIKSFLVISLFNLIFDFFVYYIFYILFDNTFVIAMVSVPLLLLWYTSLEVYMHIKNDTNFIVNLSYIILLTSSFIIFNHLFDNVFVSLLCYLTFFLICSSILYCEQLKNILKIIFKDSEEKNHS